MATSRGREIPVVMQMTPQQDPNYAYDQRDFPSDSNNSRFGQGFFNQQARLSELDDCDYIYAYDQSPGIQTQPTIITRAPPQVSQARYRVPDKDKPTDYTAPALFACICCCWPVGLLALMNAQQSHTFYEKGDLARAKERASAAKMLVITSVILGLMFLPVAICLYAFRDDIF